MSNICTETLTAKLYERRRDLPVALAHAMAGTKPTDPRLGLLNRLYHTLNDNDQLRCRAELLDCRVARRAYILRGVA